MIIFVGIKTRTDMFAKEVYVRRRKTLLGKMRESGESGIILLVGNAEAPAQYKDNCYKWRQESTWLYYMGPIPMIRGLQLRGSEQGPFRHLHR